jgi:peptidoglycan-N-acetylglucosamine deacetylase
MFKTLLAFLLLVSGALQAQSISFTFDDGFDPRVQPRAAAWNAAILDALAAAKVTAMLFPAGKNVDSPEGMALVRDWSRNGHAVGNHTYSHRNFGSGRMTLPELTADVLVAERMFRSLDGWTPRLRFPYLKEGETQNKRDGMRQWMKDHGYRPAPVSIDTSDWYYNDRFLAWRESHSTADLAPFREAYLAHLRSRAEYYEALSRTLLGRSPAHVMLLHANAINAEFLPDVLAMFRAQGWQIVAPDAAFSDPLYSSVTTTLPAGESIVWALAKLAGIPGLRYPAEDGVFEKPVLDALGL